MKLERKEKRQDIGLVVRCSQAVRLKLVDDKQKT